MPVHHQHRDSILVITVDGDFTPAEVTRVASAALAAPEAVVPAFVLLDLSGAAGMDAGSGQMTPVSDFFAGPRAPVAQLAVLASSAVAEVLVGQARATGLEARGFQRKSMALEWLGVW